MKRALCMLVVLLMLLSLSLQAFADELLYCRMCGKQIPADSKVCQYCGEKVIHPGQTAAAPAAQTATYAAPAPVPATASADTAPSVAVKTAPSPVTAVPGPFNAGSGSVSAPARVRVTKSPTSESVPYGGSCCFIAHAANATTITWYIASADSSIISTAADASRNVAGLYVSGANADTLYLNGIPSWMNGCQVQARFDGEGGPVYTDIARIWTYQPTQTYKGWCWWDWFKYYYECDPYYWDYPWYWYNYWLLNPAKAPCWFVPEVDPRPVRPDPRPVPNPKPDPRPDPKPVPDLKPSNPDPNPNIPINVYTASGSAPVDHILSSSDPQTYLQETAPIPDTGALAESERSVQDRGILDLVIEYNAEAYVSDAAPQGGYHESSPVGSSESELPDPFPGILHSDPVPDNGQTVG